jgi:YD repeat-containing protein
MTNGKFLKKSYNALGHFSQFDYEPKYGNKTSETDKEGLTTTYQYDVWGKLIQTNNPNNTQETISYS